MSPAGTSTCTQCGEPAPPAAPMGLCVVCFRRSTGMGMDSFIIPVPNPDSETPPTQAMSRASRSGQTRSSDLQADQTLARGRFTLVRKLGEGGMGEVWLAVDKDLTEGSVPYFVALKFLASEVRNDAERLNWLRREVRTCHVLHHDNIVRVFDLHAADDEPAFVAMEYGLLSRICG